ncbi:MAG TPA: elongation factor P maturation arginine rhamnosyltransferase EarP [Caldimonas sp.]|jgi:uncharacterized repeat protein (TIGR03837 family)|nr:elongation factor P maturation arginine rhamnosyltransferase EarP [Caldimonas sp.]HEX2541564.1 elongation factor P maturation arginine rhamnosyltransferase EarP [Caldimonas sp.]
MRWDLYCRVVDNFGDAGVAWRLAADLAARGERVRLAIDDPRPLAWMAPGGAPGIEVSAWADAPTPAADVIVELFGGGLPQGAREAAAGSPSNPVLLNLEHLSAEPYVERSHGLPSPVTLPSGTALTTWFYYPGFTSRTGGLLRERDVLSRRAALDPASWARSRGIEVRTGERLASLFCYANGAVGELLQALARRPTLLLLAPGPAADQAAHHLGSGLALAALRAIRLPFLSQAEFDHLLWSCAINGVRGEDSLVRALWAGAPFVWQLYPQADGAHAAKLEAFLDLFLAGADNELARPLRSLFRRWNGVDEGAAPLEIPDTAATSTWAGHCRAFRDRLGEQRELTAGLMEFVASKR